VIVGSPANRSVCDLCGVDHPWLSACDEYMPPTERMALKAQIEEGQRQIEWVRKVQREATRPVGFRGPATEPVDSADEPATDKELNAWRTRREAGIARAATLRD
jgi:hypothetical protein